MANSDKNILITPNTGATTANPTIRFTGSDNVPITLRTLDTATVSFEGSVGQLFSVTNSLTGTIFSVNDVSGIPSIEVLDTGLVKINQYNGSTTIGNLVNNINTTAKTAAYQLTAADANTVIQMNGAFAFNLDTTLAVLPLGTQITLVAQTTGVTVAANGASIVPTINATPGLRLRAAHSVATLIKMTVAAASGSASTWLLTGDLIA
jgi:hypothetical protein